MSNEINVGDVVMHKSKLDVPWVVTEVKKVDSGFSYRCRTMSLLHELGSMHHNWPFVFAEFGHGEVVKAKEAQ
jgi:hypothetical protein